MSCYHGNPNSSRPSRGTGKGVNTTLLGVWVLFSALISKVNVWKWNNFTLLHWNHMRNIDGEILDLCNHIFPLLESWHCGFSDFCISVLFFIKERFSQGIWEVNLNYIQERAFHCNAQWLIHLTAFNRHLDVFTLRRCFPGNRALWIHPCPCPQQSTLEKGVWRIQETPRIWELYQGADGYRRYWGSCVQRWIVVRRDNKQTGREWSQNGQNYEGGLWDDRWVWLTFETANFTNCRAFM